MDMDPTFGGPASNSGVFSKKLGAAASWENNDF
jgi:hypothetical protein